MSEAVELYSEGYNCGEAIIKSVNDEKSLNIPVSVGSGLGSGMCVGGTCGAIAGGVISIGFMKGRENPQEKNEARKLTKDFMDKLKDTYGTHICAELKKNGVSCKEIIEFVDNYLKDELN